MSKFLNIFRLIMQGVSDKSVQKMHAIFIKVSPDQNKAQQRWSKNLKKDKISIFNTQKKKTFTIKLVKFNKNPDRYIKYAQKFIDKDSDEQVDEKDVDAKVAELKKKVQQIKTDVKAGKVEPTKATTQIKKAYTQLKKEVPTPPKQVKNYAAQSISVIKHEIKTTTKGNEKTTKSSFSANINDSSKINKVATCLKLDVDNKYFMFNDILKKYSDEFKKDKQKNIDLSRCSYLYQYYINRKSGKKDRFFVKRARVSIIALASTKPDVFNQLVEIANKVQEKTQSKSNDKTSEEKTQTATTDKSKNSTLSDDASRFL